MLGLSAHVSETLLCQVFTSGISNDDLRLCMHYNLPGEWQQLMILICAFLLPPKQKRSTVFIHDVMDIGKSHFYDAFSFIKPFASREENTGNFCWNPLIGHNLFLLQDDPNINLITSSEIEMIKRVLEGKPQIINVKYQPKRNTEYNKITIVSNQVEIGVTGTGGSHTAPQQFGAPYYAKREMTCNLPIVE